MILDIVRTVNAAKNMKLKDTFQFMEFDDVSKEVEKDGPDTLEIWAAVKVPFEGTLPESYKVLNLLIGDWVGKHKDELTKVIHDKLKGHFKQHYPESDLSEFDGTEETSIWLDQLEDRKSVV